MEKTRSSNQNYIKFQPSNVESKISGGTADVLPEERKKASFRVQEMTEYLNGGPEGIKRKKFIENVVSNDPETQHQIYNHSRDEYLANGVKEFIGYHKPYAKFRPTREDIAHMADIGIGYGALNNSHGIFMTTIIGQGTEEQRNFWVPKVLKFEITGSYAQTELGHGSNVRGLESLAEYDKSSDEFILNTPTLKSMKWWPGCLGKVATHCVLYAQLVLEGKEHGVQVFIVQLRDENHLPLPGVRLGDLGNKVGDNTNDTGFLILENVRIPRVNMLSKYRTVTREGKFQEVGKADPKVHYTTMMATRAMMVNTAGGRLSQAATIAVRYSCVRKQGFLNNKAGISFQSEERQIIDHKIQQYRILKWLSNAYAFKFAGRWMLSELKNIEGDTYGSIKNVEGLKEVASTSAGLKSLSSYVATIGIEDLRKCCGGNGYLLNSGIAAMGSDYLWQVTAEGDFIILGLLTARFLVTSVEKVLAGSKQKNVVEYLNILGEKNIDLSKLYPGAAETPSDYLNINYLLSLFRYRSLQRCLAVTKELKALSKRMTKAEAWGLLSNELLHAAYSHCYYIIMNNFVNKVNSSPSMKLKNILGRLCSLFACTNFLDEDWSEVIQSNQHKLIRQAAYELMDQIRPDSITLVDAFDYPDKVLKSTIGRYDGNVYEALFDAAQKSTLNRQDPFVGYEKVLKPHTNKEFLSHGNKPIVNAKF